MKINTKVVFEWNPESKQYEEIYCDSYDYDGEVSECQNWYNQLYNQLFGGGSRDLWIVSAIHSSTGRQLL